jgi:hypothetical protein
MTVTIGKRKREVTQQKPRKAAHVEARDTSSADEEDQRLKAIFQKHFEAQFKPLPEKKVKRRQIEVVEEAEEVEADEDDWEGFSSEDEDAPVQVVEYSDARGDEDGISRIASKRELKAFLSGKVPTSSTTPTSTTTSTMRKAADASDDEDTKLNLKNDLALQRLLTESHLLDSTNATSSLEASGKNRLRALDLRMQSLGASTSVFDGGKMPMAMRQGITAHRAGKEEKRRREARENGIILEKEKRAKTFEGRREKGIGGPVVGKFKGGMLTLSKRDVRGIEGSGEGRRRSGAGGGKKGRR